ncbi:hypothetical protein SK128_022326 [Halocaridina rubra]|uniref:C2H2-type domain-containing protein n=1 Tax=Halocaridina rubra TaxID=373956 RepID=A0AAN8WYL4_HALRR
MVRSELKISLWNYELIVPGGSTMSALENLVGSLGNSNDETEGDLVTIGGNASFSNSTTEDPLTHESGEAADLWATNTCTSSLLVASDLTNPLLTNHHLLPPAANSQVTSGVVKISSGSCTSPSRQSCTCPLCGRHIAQRRSLKQHLMSNFHRLPPSKADSVVKEYLSAVNR